MRASYIEIVFDLNVYTRAHFSLSAKITSNSNFYHYVTSTIQLLFTTDEEAAASKRMVFYVFSAQKSILNSFFI